MTEQEMQTELLIAIAEYLVAPREHKSEYYIDYLIKDINDLRIKLKLKEFGND